VGPQKEDRRHESLPLPRDQDQGGGDGQVRECIPALPDAPFPRTGRKKKDLQAQLFGGAATEDPLCAQIAGENVAVARRSLTKHGIRIISEDTGGNMGRKIVYNSLTNEAIIYKVQNLRRGDWYPYVQEDR
jgi:chemotaxis protein CheD